ncbi:hypothetical protein ID866_2023 [Astraeus odoratus]|nr:hypothetical protein ID866_2023 [Astraeus odoratus]
MIAEILLVLAGHSSSLFPSDHTLNPAFRPLLHPGEEQCLQTLGKIAARYRNIKKACTSLTRSQSRYICALCATLNRILKDEYEGLVVETEARVLKRDPELVGQGSFVPLAAILATFSEWDAPLTALESLMVQLESQDEWKPGPLIDMLLSRSKTGINRIADILFRLSIAVQRAWRAQLAAFLLHGSTATADSIASENYVLLDGSMPSCVSPQTRESIMYIGRAIGTVKSKKWRCQIPKDQAFQHALLLETVLPDDQYKFDSVISQIRTDVSEWLWLHVLTRKDVEEAVVSLANYFLLRNGEFSLALILDIEQLKITRLTTRSGVPSMIKEQDLNLALLRASLGTTAQHDPSLLRFKFQLPSGPIRPLLRALEGNSKHLLASLNGSFDEPTSFDDLLLGTSLLLTYDTAWPLDLFLHPSDLQIYFALFSYLSAIRKTQTRVHGCWTSLSNSQRARRRWTGLGEGGTTEDLDVRKRLLRCGWGVVRDMGWFLDTLLEYVMVDVVDREFRRLKDLINEPPRTRSESIGREGTRDGNAASSSHSHIDFTTLRNIHTTYLERLVAGCLLSQPALTAIVRPILEICERFVAQVERWGGDVLPALLFEGSLATGTDGKVGVMVQERVQVVSEINEVIPISALVVCLSFTPQQSLHVLLESFYRQLSLMTSYQPFTATGDASKSVLMNTSFANASTFQRTFVRGKGFEGDGEVRRHVEQLLLRLDFNGRFSKPKSALSGGADDIKKGRLRYVRNCFPHHGYIWNYGAFPQTWEDPTVTHAETKAQGDNDPLDVCEIGEQVGYTGQVKQVKVLGIMALLDEGETDWKVIVVDVHDPLAPKLNDIEDVERHLPGLIRATNEWFRIYKIPDGKAENTFAFSGEAKNKKYATEIIHECHEAWRRLITGETPAKAPTHDISIRNLTIPGPGLVKPGDQAFPNIPPDSRQPPALIDPSINKWFYISSVQV